LTGPAQGLGVGVGTLSTVGEAVGLGVAVGARRLGVTDGAADGTSADGVEVADGVGVGVRLGLGVGDRVGAGVLGAAGTTALTWASGGAGGRTST
jgi:hypothetical protein